MDPALKKICSLRCAEQLLLAVLTILLYGVTWVRQMLPILRTAAHTDLPKIKWFFHVTINSRFEQVRRPNPWKLKNMLIYLHTARFFPHNAHTKSNIV
jgi:hypothetical protein